MRDVKGGRKINRKARGVRKLFSAVKFIGLGKSELSSFLIVRQYVVVASGKWSGKEWQT